MVFLVVMASKTGLTCGDLPRMWHMASGARGYGVSAIFMQPFRTPVAGLAIDHGLNFRLPKMACFTSHRHHRSRGIDFVTGDTIERRPVTCPVAKVAEDLFVFSFKLPWVPRFGTGRCSGSEGKQGPTLRHRVAHRASTGEHSARLAYMPIVMASEASGPVAMAYVVGIGHPVYLHGWKNVSVVDGENGVDGLANQGFLAFQDIWEILSVVFFDKSTYFILNLLPVIIVFD